MIYNTMCDRTDGFGAQFQTIIQSILITECNNQIYLHNKIKTIEHNYDNNPEYLNKIENLMNLKDNFGLVENNLRSRFMETYQQANPSQISPYVSIFKQPTHNAER